MKDKILVFIIGLLVGALITASVFLICEKVNKNTNQISDGGKMQMMERPDGETPPEKPDGIQNDENRPEHPSKNTSTIESNKTN